MKHEWNRGRSLKLAICWLGMVCLALVAGCGGTGTLSGKVTYKGQPVRMGTVLVSSAGGIQSGIIQDDGSYTVTGVSSGEVKIAVTSPDPRTQIASPRKKDEKPATVPADVVAKWRALPDKYEKHETSGLTHTMSGGDNTRNLELE